MNPSYHDLADHTETIQITFDPVVVSYRELLEIFWQAHNATMQPYSRQYMSAIFYHGEEQQQIALESSLAEGARKAREVFTEIIPAPTFWPAEDYHQKYYLQGYPKLFGELSAIYPDMADLAASTAAARVNGYLGGYGEPGQFAYELPRLGLSASAQERLAEIAENKNPGLCPVPG